MQYLIDKLSDEKTLTKAEFISLLQSCDNSLRQYLFKIARETSQKHFGNKIYTRGLIEFTSYCKNDCYYCGIRRSNKNARRYRLKREEILLCCKNGYALGFRTFVLQGGDDAWYTDERLVSIISEIRLSYPDCAITLSLGEKSYEQYKMYFDAGADRYLLRHESVNPEHYLQLHPPQLKADNRKRCLYDLKEIGYQVGAGFMVGSPFQTYEYLAQDLLFLKALKPEMIGIGPFIPSKDTPFHIYSKGSLELTLTLIAVLRLMLPNAMIPATTALGTIHNKGRELGILAGANVVMPNLSPVEVREKYMLYDNKICTGEEAAECRLCLNNRMKSIGYELVVDRGDFLPVKEEEEREDK